MEPGARLPHWAGLDGLRGLAVVAVLLFHADVSWARGGFLGVSLFFTLSGFLITSLVVREHGTTGGVSLTHFWARRARRLLPASLVALGMAMVVTMVVIPRAQQAEAMGDIRAAALNLANWRFIWRGEVYADITRLPSPVQHYWSLAIEEQFYLVFPLLAVLTLRRSRTVLAVAFALVVAWSLRQQLVIDDRARIYFGTDARAAELAVGGLLALGHGQITRLLGRWRASAADVLGVVALGATALLWWQVPNTSEALHGGGFVAIAVVSALLVLGAVEGRRLPAVLRVGPLAALGLVSYGVYLYHFPVYLALDEPRLPLPGGPLLVVRVLVSVALAGASYALLERPVRAGTLLRGHRSTATFAGGLCVVLLAGVILTAQVEDRDRSGELAADVEVTLGPALPLSATRPRAPHIVVVGDSTAATLGRGLEPWGRETGHLQVTTVASQGCATLTGERLRVRQGYDFVPKGCDVLFSTAAEVAEQQGADAIVVLIGSSQLGDWLYAGGDGWRDITDDEIQAAYREALDRALEDLEVAGIPILWADLPVPRWDLDAFGELLGGPLPGSGPVVVNDPERAAIVNSIDASIVPAHPLAVVWGWTDLLTGPDGEIPEGLRFDGLHVDMARIPGLAENGLVTLLDDAYDRVAARGAPVVPTGHAWGAAPCAEGLSCPD